MRWKPIPSYEGHYEISDTGLCRSLKTYHFNRADKERLLTPNITRCGYVTYGLCLPNKERKFINAHRVAWEVFNSLIPEGLQINHKNGIKTDNRLCNLEVVTMSENMTHRYRELGLNGVQGSKSHYAKLTEADVLEIRALLEAGLKQLEIARRFNVGRTNISLIKNRKTWFHI